MNYKDCRENRHTCNIFMFIYLMVSKLLYKLMDWKATMSKQPAFPANTQMSLVTMSYHQSGRRHNVCQKTSELRRLENVGFAKF